MTRVLSVFCLLALMLVVCPEPINSAPTVLVRDRVDIHLDPIRRLNSNAVIRGQVVYRSTDEGIANAIVQIQIDEGLVNIVADEEGWFSYSLEILDGNHVINIAFEGSDLLDPAWTKIDSFNFIKNPVLLTAELPTEVLISESSLELHFRASSDGEPISLPTAIFFGLQTGNLRKLGTSQSGKDGEGVFSIASELFQKPGRYRCELLFSGNDDYDSAIARASLTVNASNNLTLSTQKGRYELGEPLLAEGTLVDGQGIPVEMAAIALEINAQHLSDSTTDATGRFRFLVDTEELGSGSSTLQAVYRPNESWNSPGRSKPLTISIGARQAVPIRSTLFAFALTAIALLTFVGLRTRPWEKWKKADDEAEDNTERQQLDAVITTGLTQSKKKLGGTLRRATFFDFSGVVVSATTKQRVAGAKISFPNIPVGSNAQPTQADSEGLFESVALVEGDYQVLIVAKGYVREEFAISIPHRGEFHNATIKLLPVREKIFQLYKQAVQKHLPKPTLWGIWTPRQILDYARQNRPSPPLSDLTEFVEETFFSQRTPDEELLAVAEDKIRALQST